ncbi:MAG: DUF4012 domain-containing protein [Patescibacteria group bacterium]
MSEKKRQLNISNSSLAPVGAGFVVDLRKKINSTIADEAEVLIKKQKESKLKVEKTEKVIAQKTLRELKSLEKDVSKIRPNLLRISRAKRPARSPRQAKVRARTVKSLWAKVAAEQTELFKQATRLNFRTIRASAELEKKIAAAEAKATWYRSVFSFVFVLILLVIPLKLLSYFNFFDLSKVQAEIVDRSQSAMTSLMAATNSVTKMDFKSADTEFQSAGANFLAAKSQLDNISDSILALAALSGDPKLKLAAESKKFLRAGVIASALGSNLVLATDSLFSGDKENFSSALDHFSYYGSQAVNNADDLQAELKKINPDNLPPEYQAKFISISQQATLLSENLATFIGAGSKLKDFLGATNDKRYLLVFQNNSEMRATGGFIGSYALVDVRDGKIRNLEVPGGGSYDMEAGMNVRVAAPKPLWLVNPLWHFWDANWWPNWPTTAKNLMWFYEKSDGPTVDGVIGVTPTVVEKLLAITGPIDLTKEYGLTIDADNFWETVQKIVEQKNLASSNPSSVAGVPASSTPVLSSLPIKQDLEINADNKPKKIIGDLMAKIMETLPKKLNSENLVKILALFEESLSEKQVLFYFSDPALEAEVASRNWAGEIKNTDRDYLAVINTNIAGQKSDRMMAEKIEQTSEVAADGSIINTLKITRTHTGVKNEVMTGVRNVDWLRVYVPGGSELLSADGFRAPDAKYLTEKPDPSWTENPLLDKENRALIDESSGTKVYAEDDKTVFANWLMVDPGESAVVTLKYRLPFNFFATTQKNDWLSKIDNFINPESAVPTPYSLLVQKQAGAVASDFSSQLVLPASVSLIWSYPENLSGDHGWSINTKLDADKYWSILIKNNNQ